MKRKQNKNTLYCFSPPVMIATMVVEIGLACYALWRHKNSALRNIFVVTLLLLAFFQFAEYQVCSNTLGQPELWSRLGYAAITFLPTLGVHAISVISGRKNRQLLVVLYAVSLAFALFFIFTPGVIGAMRCTGRYVIFALQPAVATLYYLFYNAVIFMSLGLAIAYFLKEKRQNIRHAYAWFVVGSLTFFLPTGIMYILRPSSLDSLPSIMCGLAIGYALIIGLRVLPLVSSKNQIRKKKAS